MDNEKASILSSFEEIFFWAYFEDIIAKLKANRFYFLNNRLAGFLNMTEGLSILADQVGHVFFPLCSQL